MRPTSRRTPRLLAGDDDATNDDAGRRSRPSSRDDAFRPRRFPSSRPERFSGNYTRPCVLVPRGRSQGSARRARAFTRGRSFVHTFKGARTDARVRRAVHGRCARPVSFYRIAMSFPRVRDLEFSRCESPRLARLQRDDARRGDACIIDQVKTSSIILQSTTSTLLPIRARARA